MKSTFLSTLVIFSLGLWTSCRSQDKTTSVFVETESVSARELLNGPITKAEFNILTRAQDSLEPDDSPIMKQVTYIYKDRQKNIWFGTQGLGICKYMGTIPQYYKTYSNYHYHNDKNGFSARLVTGIIEDNEGKIWISTDVGVMLYQVTGFVLYTEEQGLPSHMVTGIIKGKNGTLWAATTQGLCFLDGNKFKKKSIPHLEGENILSMAEDTKGNLWFSVENHGLYKYDGVQFKNFESENIPTLVVAGPSGKIYVANNRGDIYTIYEDKIEALPTHCGRKDQTIVDILEDSKGRVWYSTSENGLYKVKDESVYKQGPLDGLHLETVTSIFEDELGQLWIGGENGVYLYREEGFVEIKKNWGC